MTLKIFNSFGNKLEEFVPLKGKDVGLYTCGPTVYDNAHIGNFRAYAWEDILRRYLEYSGYKVKQIMNLTDVDDKTIRGANENKMALSEYTEKYKKSFFEDVNALNILPAHNYTSATEHIPEMVKLVETLMEKGFAYRGDDDSIYFSIKKFPNYGKLAGIDVTKLKDGARIKQDEYEKEGVGDFAVWKAWDEDDGTVFWETSLGKGRPGWHIECSAMSMKYLGETFDLHTGGVDNKFPHHENEIAQSEAATGKKFVKYWMHCEHLLVNGKKMAKSAGTFYTLRDLIDKGLNPKAIRYVLINSQYRQQINFVIDSVHDAEKAIDGIQRFIDRVRNINEGDGNAETEISDLITSFEGAMDNDLGVPNATKALFEFVKKVNTLIDNSQLGKTGAENVLDALKKVDSVLGIMDFTEVFFEVTDEQQKLIDERNVARNAKDFAKSDELRDKLKAEGIELVDNPDGTTTAKAA
ncbi:MAG: cysteine--tRNA ligase [Candidatus Diapherotrites archaeon]|nr:cysteine--tRNA ligase [Candidatus Diapherotrites archaeon]